MDPRPSLGGSQSPPHQLVTLGERCELPQRGPGGVPAAKRSSLHSIGAKWPLLKLVEGEVQGEASPRPL